MGNEKQQPAAREAGETYVRLSMEDENSVAMAQYYHGYADGIFVALWVFALVIIAGVFSFRWPR
jgi:hypothetical protein